ADHLYRTGKGDRLDRRTTHDHVQPSHGDIVRHREPYHEGVMIKDLLTRHRSRDRDAGWHALVVCRWRRTGGHGTKTARCHTESCLIAEQDVGTVRGRQKDATLQSLGCCRCHRGTGYPLHLRSPIEKGLQIRTGRRQHWSRIPQTEYFPIKLAG